MLISQNKIRGKCGKLAKSHLEKCITFTDSKLYGNNSEILIQINP